jgi:hypothetical protein
MAGRDQTKQKLVQLRRLAVSLYCHEFESFLLRQVVSDFEAILLVFFIVAKPNGHCDRNLCSGSELLSAIVITPYFRDARKYV